MGRGSQARRVFTSSQLRSLHCERHRRCVCLQRLQQEATAPIFSGCYVLCGKSKSPIELSCFPIISEVILLNTRISSTTVLVQYNTFGASIAYPSGRLAQRSGLRLQAPCDVLWPQMGIQLMLQRYFRPETATVPLKSETPTDDRAHMRRPQSAVKQRFQPRTFVLAAPVQMNKSYGAAVSSAAYSGEPQPGTIDLARIAMCSYCS